MRISDSMISELSSRGLEKNRETYFEAQRAANTGLRVEKPSDDPVASSLSRDMLSRERRSEEVVRIADRAVGELQAVDDTLGGVTDVLSKARELAVYGANDHLTVQDREALASEVSSLRKQMLGFANAKFSQGYVFGGLAVDRPPFDDSGAFVGETALVEIDVGPGVRLPTQITGGDVFGTSPGGTNAFETLDALEAALRADDPIAINALLPDLDTTLNQAADGRTTAGVTELALMQASAVAQRVRDDSKFRRAGLVEADQLEAFTELVGAENAMRQAVTLAARMAPPSLLDIG